MFSSFISFRRTKTKNQRCKMNKKEVMYCVVIDDETGKVCGEIDETHTAYCIKHGRSPHRMKSVESIEKTNGGVK